MKTTPEVRNLIANTVHCYPGELGTVGDLLADFNEEHEAAEHWRELQSALLDRDVTPCDTAAQVIEFCDSWPAALLHQWRTDDLRVYQFTCGGEQFLIAARGVAEACAIFWKNCDEYDPAPNGAHQGELPAIRPIPKRKWEHTRIRDEDAPGGVTTVAAMLEGENATPGVLGSTLE